MQLTVRLSLDNAEAAEDVTWAAAHYLRQAAQALDRGQTAGRIQDGNGNTVGQYVIDDGYIKAADRPTAAEMREGQS